VEFLDMIFPLIAWGVCALLFMLQSLFGAAFTFSLLGHLTQFVSEKSSLNVERSLSSNK